MLSLLFWCACSPARNPGSGTQAHVHVTSCMASMQLCGLETLVWQSVSLRFPPTNVPGPVCTAMCCHAELVRSKHLAATAAQLLGAKKLRLYQVRCVMHTTTQYKLHAAGMASPQWCVGVCSPNIPVSCTA
jgi:hypothetical protein